MKKCGLALELILIFIGSMLTTACGDDDTSPVGMGDDDPVNSVRTRLPQAIIDVGRYTSSYLLDTDQDGDDDIILGPADGAFSTNVLLINDGTGYFEIKANAFPGRYQGINGHTVNIVSGDFNNDGRPDIIATTIDARSATFSQSAQIHLYLNNGDNSFSDATPQISDNLFPDTWIEWIRVGDFNNDGTLDFVTTVAGGDGWDPANVAWSGGLIYLNDGSANFTRAVIRMNDNDVLGEYTHPALAWDNGGVGEITRLPLDILVGDVDNDGDVDLVAPNGFAGGRWATFLNIGVGTEASFEVVLNGDDTGGAEPVLTKNGALMDIDGDGFLDVIASRSIDGFGPGAPIEIFLNDGSGRFSYVSGLIAGTVPGLVHARQWLVGDFNNDSQDDLFVADHGLDQWPFPGFPNTLLLSSGGSLSNSSSNVGTASAFTHGAAIGDIDNDGDLDIFMNNQRGLEDIGGASSDGFIYLNNGSGVFTVSN